MDCLAANSISTFGGNPLVTAAANATLDYVLSHDLQANAAKVGGLLFDGIRDLQEKHPFIGDVRGKGLMIGVELVLPGSKTPDVAGASRVMEQTKARGLLVGKGGLYGNVLRIAPPLTLSADEASEGLELLAQAFAAAESAA
jgi:4-aminobutyrate aminotransferase